MKKLIMSILLSALLPTVASAEFKGESKLSSAGYNENGGISLINGKSYFTTVEYVNGSDAKFTIYNRDLSVMKQFTIPNVYIDESSYSVSVTNLIHEYTYKNDDIDIYCTQNLFNSDEKIEVVICECVKKDGEYSYTNRIYNEDGDYLGFISLEDGSPMGIYDVNEDGSCLYLVLETYVYVDSKDVYSVSFYSFTDGSGVESPKLVRTVSRAYPNPLPSGRSLTIDFATSMTSAGYVQVADLSGAVVYRAEVESGASRVNVPARCLRGGTYVYSLYCNGEVVDSGKILTK